MPSDEDQLPSLAPVPGQPVPIPVSIEPEPEPEPDQSPEPPNDPDPPNEEKPEPTIPPEQPDPDQESPDDEQDQTPEADEQPSVSPEVQPFVPIKIDNVNTSVREYIKQHKRWQVMLFVPCMVLWEVLAIIMIVKLAHKGFFSNSANSQGNGKLIGALIGFPFFIASAEYYRIQKQFEAAFLQQFAASNGFYFNVTEQLDEAYGTIFKIKGTPTVSDVVTGDYAGSTLRVFLYQLQVGKARFQDTVIELDLHGRLPNLMLVSKGSRYNQVDLSGTFKKNSDAQDAVQLEGNFNDYFTLFCKEGNDIEAREVFTPDIMQLAMDESKRYSIETVNNRIYIYANHYIGTTTELSDVFVLAKKLIDKLSPLAGRMAEDEMVSVPPANAIKVRKRHPVVDKILTALMVLVCVGGLAFVVYIAFIAKTAPITTEGTLTTSSPYSININLASNLDTESSTTHNNGSQIVADAQKALVASSNSQEKEYSYYYIGDGYFWEGNYPAGLASEQQAMQLNPKDPYPYVLEGNILVDEQQNAQALVDANQALHLNPNLATGYRLKAIALANLGQKAQAIQAIEQATVLDEGPNKSQFKSDDLTFYTYINNTNPPLSISP